MEKKIHFGKKLLWASMMVQIAMMSTAENDTTTTELPQETEVPELVSAYAWSAWGSWSPCSRSCGGGISMQERHCLPRQRNGTAENVTVTSSETPPRVRRQAHPECQGDEKRYHECNTASCPGGMRNSRAVQCAAYDGRPFRGRFYTWVPYIDAGSPCTLNCRPMGQQFYASLSLVSDGTPCTRQGSRAVCVQGVCKIVGEAVLSSASSRELHCGRRLVSGLFTRPRLPLGYSYVTTVPRGACRLNVTEIAPSENYIALKISNSSYIMNGEFAVSAPGTYEAAGARFVYTRGVSLDAIFSLGPIHHPIDIMILYNNQPNPSIKYEYLIDSLPGEMEADAGTRAEYSDAPSTSATKHYRRHHSDALRPGVSISRQYNVGSKDTGSTEEVFEDNVIGTRKFVWKIAKYSQCTRSCGGGIQLGKYRCVEIIPTVGDKEVSAVHCPGSAPPSRRRRCGDMPCPPRWRAANWSGCPRCGPATRTRIVGCVQDHSRGITKISDQKCPPPKPLTMEKCNIPDCNIHGTGEVRQITSKRVVRPREHTDTFREGPVYTIAVNATDVDIGPEYSYTAAAGWLYTDWSECVGWCVGGGVQSRSIRCGDPSGCTPRKSPDGFRPCQPKLTCESLDGHWFTGEWSPCSSNCRGKQIRGVLCIGGTGRHLKDSACKDPKPQQERECENECSPAWYYSEWGQCIGNCSNSLNVGLQRRSVVCARGDRPAVSDAECPPPAPHAHRTCDLQCASPPISTMTPDLSIESQKISGYDTTTMASTASTQRNGKKYQVPKDCEDKLNNCALAVQARLCHYKYYIHNCCHSCVGR